MSGSQRTITTSTRRLAKRPSCVSLLATGMESPKPNTPTLDEATPLASKNDLTASALSKLNSWLLIVLPTLSVWPSTRTRTSGCPSIHDAKRSQPPWYDDPNKDFPVSN